MPGVQAFIAFDLAKNGVGNWLTLDDPVKGVLDGVTYTLSGDVLVDVTDRLRSFSIKRGRSRQLDRFTAGNASLSLDNRDRMMDPTNSASPYYGSIIPRKRVLLTYNDIPLATTMVEDWNFTLTLDDDSLADVSCVDGFSLLTEAVLTPGTATAELTGARVAAVLDDIDWPAALRHVSTGGADLAADAIAANTSALTYLQKVETSEGNGALFIGASGSLTFRDRSDLSSFMDGVVFGTDGLPFIEWKPVYGTEELVNTVSVTYPGGTATAIGTASVAHYGPITATYETLLANGTEAQYVADYQVAAYAEPVYRVDSVSVLLESLPAAQVMQAIAIELGDVVRVSFQPGGTGAWINQYTVVDGIAHAADPSRHVITFTLSQTLLGFVLDSPTLGILDTSTLGF